FLHRQVLLQAFDLQLHFLRIGSVEAKGYAMVASHFGRYQNRTLSGGFQSGEAEDSEQQRAHKRAEHASDYTEGLCVITIVFPSSLRPGRWRAASVLYDSRDSKPLRHEK